MFGICVSCGGLIKRIDTVAFSGWVHDAPLSELRVTQQEADRVHADPPRANKPMHRESVLHQPIP